MTERDAAILQMIDDGLTYAQVAERLSAQRPEWACSVGTISRVAIRSGRRARKVRADAGATKKRVRSGDMAAIVAIKSGVGLDAEKVGDKLPRGGSRVASWMAIREAEERGIVPRGAISPAWLNRRLRTAYGLQQRGVEAKRTGPAVVRRVETRRAGAQYQFDGTLLPMFHIDASGDFVYQPETELKSQLKRAGKTRAYVLGFLDAHSRAFRLHACDGETARHTLAAARGVMTRSDDPLRPFCGLPSMIYGDNGSAAASSLCRAAWQRLGVSFVAHKPRRAWSKGKIERMFGSTNAVQELMRGRRIRSFAELADLLRDMELELNNRVHSRTGQSPYDRFLASAEAHGSWRYAPADDAFWRRLMMTRVDRLLVAPDLTVGVGGGERISLPMGRPYIDWIGARISVLLDAPPGGLARAPKRQGPWAQSGGETCIVVDPLMRHEYEIPRVGPQVYASVASVEIPDSAAVELLRAAAQACEDGVLQGPLGAWLGKSAPRRSAPAGRVIDPARQEQRPVEKLDRHEALSWLVDLGALDARDSGDRELFELLMRGRDAIERSALEAFLDHGVLPEPEEEAA